MYWNEESFTDGQGKLKDKRIAQYTVLRKEEKKRFTRSGTIRLGYQSICVSVGLP